MKKWIVPVALTIVAVGLLGACEKASVVEGDPSDQPEMMRIGISQLAEHKALDATRKGFLDALDKAGFKEGETVQVDVKIAHGDEGENEQIAETFAAGEYDLLLGISTPSATSLQQKVKDAGKATPILFTAVTDPVGAGLVSSIEAEGSNVSGTSDTHPDVIVRIADTMKELYPKATVGILRSDEQNAVSIVQTMKAELERRKMKYVVEAVPSEEGIADSVKRLMRKSDLLYIPVDNLLVSNLEVIGAYASAHKKPLFTGEGNSVRDYGGGFMAYGFEYEDLGYQTGEMAVKLLTGAATIAELPVEFPNALNLYVNYGNAREQAIPHILGKVRQVPEDYRENLIEINK